MWNKKHFLSFLKDFNCQKLYQTLECTFNILKVFVKANNPNFLKKFGGILELTGQWATDLPKKQDWSKRKRITEKMEPSPEF